MFEKLIRFSIDQRWLVMLLAIGMAVLGVFSYQQLPIENRISFSNITVLLNF